MSGHRAPDSLLPYLRNMSAPQEKQETEAVEHHEKVATEHIQLKSDLDELGLWQTALRFRKAVLVCFLLCVAAAADGYQVSAPKMNLL